MSEPRRVLKLQCPHCGEWDSVVKDGRPNLGGYRRKRRCLACQRTYFTLERPETQNKVQAHNIS
jgi:transcriptional regulator NrdR family protein